MHHTSFTVQEKLEVLSERLEQATGASADKVSVQDSADDAFGAKQLQAVKKCECIDHYYYYSV